MVTFVGGRVLGLKVLNLLGWNGEEHVGQLGGPVTFGAQTA